MRRQSLRLLASAAITTLLIGAHAPPAGAWDIDGRWTNTKTDGGGIQRGDAITLLWSVVPDGESYSRANNSDLIDYLDDGWNVSQGNRGADLTNRPWWSIMDRVYSQYARVSGLTMVYEPEQNPDGSDTGLSGDIRIGGVPFTWENDTAGVLADNSLPNNGDMRIDTYRSGGPSWWHSNPAPFRNLISHESGHGVGLNHDSSNDYNFVMETPLKTSFWGLQFDDIYAFNRIYGDPLEKNGGNDTLPTATPLGHLTDLGSVRLGRDANSFVVEEMDDQWLGIDGSSDTDWFSFTTTSTALVDVKVTPLGPSYTTEKQGSVDTSAKSDLSFRVLESLGSRSLAVGNSTGLGEAEEVIDMLTPGGGEFYIEVVGAQDQNQFYQLDVSVWDIGVAADLNGNGMLDLDDWNRFKQNQGKVFAETRPELAAAGGDMDGDFDNDFLDFKYFKLAFLGEYGASGLAELLAAPEPTSLASMLVAMVVASLAPHRRHGA